MPQFYLGSVSLYSIMVKFSTGHILEFLRIMIQNERMVALMPQFNNAKWVPEQRVGLIEKAELLESECSELGLSASAASANRLKICLQRDQHTPEIARLSRDLQSRLEDELKDSFFFGLPPSTAKYFFESLFSQAVIERFPEATFDMTEAGKCLALERSTACVFHLMRVTEYGLNEIARQVGIPDPRATWEPIILKIDAELKTPYENRKFKGSADLLAHISAHLNAVKLAWRNKVMHVEEKYTSEEAREIYNATTGLMRYLADNLPKKEEGVIHMRSVRK